jgi:hypothetical protein
MTSRIVKKAQVISFPEVVFSLTGSGGFPIALVKREAYAE